VNRSIVSELKNLNFEFDFFGENDL
jgi:hypothetical protein